ncbi:MAG: TonB-dependent receptor [candidate division KSB1 bacterium]|nr:TonB-dependent receptor [candidate division KSB1 bacterium]
MKKSIHFLICLFLVAILFMGKGSLLYSQHQQHQGYVHGTVMGIKFDQSAQDTISLAGANVYWAGTSLGTTTDALGNFQLKKPKLDSLKLIVSYVEYKNDTLIIDNHIDHVMVFLKQIRTTEGLEVTAERPHIFHSAEEVRATQTITESGLRTLACCTLSESFENTNTVDVEKSDAISGAKRIKMLGLAGFYTQVLIEKKPVIRGLIAPFALDYVPGPWMESIDISKGTASVMTGYESTTGQINVEFKKPEKDEPLFFNIYQNSMGKTESSLGVSHRFNDRLSTMVLAYGNLNRLRHDKNDDTFMDMPLSEHLHVMNRWKFQPGDLGDGQLGFTIIHDHRDGGQTDFDFDNHTPHLDDYGFHTKTNRQEVYAKFGRALDQAGSSSIGFIFSAFRHNNDAFWGTKTYQGNETSLYGNLIFQKTLGAHDIATGVSFVSDRVDEIYNDADYKKNERVPGIFIEHTWKPTDKVTTLAGFRYDRHSLYGNFYTPRFHVKYLWTPATIIRLSAGKGYRSAHLFMENLAILASSKRLSILENPEAEEAWNYGIQLSRDFTLGYDRPATLIVDFYRTTFQNRVIVDTEQAADQIYVYNLNGAAFSNSFQIELNATIFSGFQSILAWRWNDVKMTINGRLLEEPLTNRHKGLLVLSYQTPSKNWQFDLTTQLNSKSRLPNTEMNPENYRTAAYSPAYVMMFGQIKRKFKNLEFYIGVENITNYIQPNPILAWQEPFSPYFDSSRIWGPVVGRQIYAGIRVN